MGVIEIENELNKINVFTKSDEEPNFTGLHNLRYIQELLLVHSSSKTTEIYTHVSTRRIQQIKSPFDDL
jgi:hypothetical protein